MKIKIIYFMESDNYQKHWIEMIIVPGLSLFNKDTFCRAKEYLKKKLNTSDFYIDDIIVM